MSLGQYALNLALLAFVLVTNLGTRVVSPRRTLLPLVLVVVAVATLLRDVPTAGHDLALELAGALVGVVLGLVAGLLMRVQAHGGRLCTSAGGWYAALWIAVIGGRMVFAYGADHWFARSIGRFSLEHQITGADAWTAGFVLMALAMVLTRVAVTAGAVVLVRHAAPRGAQVVA